MPKTSHLAVWLHGAQIATISQDRRRRLTLHYTDTGTPADLFPLSVSMPRTARTHPHRVVDAFLANLLPDRPEVLRSWRAAYQVTDPSPFALLAHVGGDVAGAARFLPDWEDPTRAGTFTALTDEDIADRIDRALTDQPAAAQPSAGQFSLAGAQAKIALHRDVAGRWGEATGALPTTYILKPAIPRYPDQDINEHLTMLAARLTGLPVAETTIGEFAGRRVLIVTRFDRTHTPGGWQRVHQEDFCQVLGLHPDRKYEYLGGPSAKQIGQALRQAVSAGAAEEDTWRFADALLFNWIVVGTDAHAKNYSLVHNGIDARLAPLYDLNSFLPYRVPGTPANLSMRVGGVSSDADGIDRHDWTSAAKDLGLKPADLLARAAFLLDRVPLAMAEAAERLGGQWGDTLSAGLVTATAGRCRALAAAL